MSPTTALVLAGGSGQRFRAGRPNALPKQLLPLDGRPLFAHCLATYLGLDEVDRVVLAVPSAHADRFAAYLDQRGWRRRVTLVEGGATRRDSIDAALRATPADDAGLVVLQNAASPLTSAALIRDCLRRAAGHDAVQAWTPALHTVFTHTGGWIDAVLPRPQLGYTCDPTVYRRAVLARLLAAAGSADPGGEDTLSLARRLGVPVALVRSDRDNLKVTTAADLDAAAALLRGPGGG